MASNHFIKSNRGVLFRKWTNNVLKEYMLKGNVINENYVNLINKVESIDNRLVDVENKIINNEIPIEKIFYNGEIYDAYSLIEDIFRRAKKEIVIIDNNELYHLGASIKDAGKKIFGISKMAGNLVSSILNNL